jgi:tetratricopeptide (TPR) repeat protein
MKYLRGFIFLISLGFVSIASSQAKTYDFNENCRNAYHEILNLELEKARILVINETKQNPQNLFPVLLENYIDFLGIVLTEDQNLFNEKKDLKIARIEKWRQGPKNNPWYLAGQAQIKLQWAFARVLFNEYYLAATDINSAYHLLEENHRNFPAFLPDNMGLGVLHAMIGVVPGEYQWAMEMLGLRGTIEQGRSDIEEQITKEPWQPMSLEALFYFTFIQLNLQADANRLQILWNYYDSEPFKTYTAKSPLLQFSKAVLLQKMDNEAVIDFLISAKPSATALPFYYPQYILGQALLYKLEPTAMRYLDIYLERYPGDNYKKAALQKSAWASFIAGDSLAYRQKMSKILSGGKSVFDADKSAEKEASKVIEGYIPDLYLLKSRMQFDGLYLDGALVELNKANLQKSNMPFQLEYYYRKGRIYHEKKELNLAEKSYEKALKLGATSDSYFAGNAALKLGEMTEMQHQYKKAREYYERCLELEFTEYRKGIRAKAKAGLQRLQNVQ